VSQSILSDVAEFWAATQDSILLQEIPEKTGMELLQQIATEQQEHLSEQ